MIEEIKRKKGIVFRAQLRAPNRKRYSQCFNNRKEAEKWLIKKRYEFQKGIIPEKTRELIVFNELVRLWYQNKVKTTNSPRTIKNYTSDVRVHLLPWLAPMPITEIKRKHGNELILRMQGNNSARTINKILSRLKQILNYAVDSELLASNPLARFSKVKEPPPKEFYLTSKEIQQLLVSNNQEWIYPLLLLALNTGMRLGELAGLCWDRVNFETNFIEVTRTLTREGLQQTTKSHKKRFVPMNMEVQTFLKAHRRKQLHPEFVLANEKLNPLDVNHVSQRAFKEACKRAQLGPGIKFHGLRHTFASHFMMNGGNIYDLQKILGHFELNMTMRYAHLSPQHLQNAMGIVSFTGHRDPQNDPQRFESLENLVVLGT